MCLLTRSTMPHMRLTGYPNPVIPVRLPCNEVYRGQYRLLPVGFLHCIPHGKPACHLLMLRGACPVAVHTGSPSRIRDFTLWNISKLFHGVNPLDEITPTPNSLLKKICIFKLFLELRVWVRCCSCRAHTGHDSAYRQHFDN